MEATKRNEADNTSAKPRETSAQPKSGKRFKGRPVYTNEEAADPNFEFPFPPEPEWEAEWKRRKSEKDKK